MKLTYCIIVMISISGFACLRNTESKHKGESSSQQSDIPSSLKLSMAEYERAASIILKTEILQFRDLKLSYSEDAENTTRKRLSSSDTSDLFVYG